MFELARLDSDAIELQLESIPLAELASDIVKEFQWRAEHSGIRLSLQVSDADITAHTDLGPIARVLENLTGNAIRHTARDGRVDVRLEALERRVRVSVVDNGSGIDPEILPHIFDRWFSAALDAGPANGSSGLGLAIAQRILDMHGTSIEVESHPGEGKRFSFELPRHAGFERMARGVENSPAA